MSIRVGNQAIENGISQPISIFSFYSVSNRIPKDLAKCVAAREAM